MFKKLRNRLILTNFCVTTGVLVLAFSTIYFIASSAAHSRPLLPQTITYNSDVSTIIIQRLNAEKTASLSDLLVTLIIIGIVVEIIVILISFYFAEQAIKPIKNSYNLQKTFIANASHEIKTPLAVIQANLEAADIKNNHWIDNARAKIEELTSLNQQLLNLTRLDSPLTPNFTKTTIDLIDFVQTTTNFYEPKLQQKRIKLSIHHAKLKKPTITIDSTALANILNILLDNAIKYCESTIKINLTDSSISITNDGATIPASQLPHIFDRFYQTDKTKPGVGLGLAIAKSTADQHHWHLSVTSNRTTTFTLTFAKPQLIL